MKQRIARFINNNKHRDSQSGHAHVILAASLVVLLFTFVGYRVLTVSHAAPSIPSDSSSMIKVDPKASSVMPFGLFKSTNNLQYTFPSVPKYAIQYYGWQEGFQTADATTAWGKGTESFVELQTCGNPCDSTGIPIANVTSGSYDSYLKSFATSVKSFNHPVLITFDHEMNGDWYPWGDTKVSAAQWIAAWKHVTNVMSAIAPNITWVWAPNIESGAASVASYWPGTSAHVGMVGLDGYYQTTGSTYANTFQKSITDVHKVSGGKYPLIIAETGVPAADSNNVFQINNLVAGARADNVKAIMYFDASTKWSFTSSGKTAFVNDVK